jgi:hypothetical protein
MLRRPISRAAATAVVAGAVCALSAGTALAAPAAAPAWPGGHGVAVPHAFSNATPALSRITLTGTGRNGTLVAWKGQRDDKIHYETRISGHWSAGKTIPGTRARTSDGPSVGFYPDPTGHDAVLAVWKQLGSTKILWSQGQAHSDGKVAWTKPRSLGSSSLERTTTAPSVMFPADAPHDRVIVAWKGPFNHVRYVVGTPSGRGFHWSSSTWLSSAHREKTSSAPALAQVQTGRAKGTVYVLWRGYHSHVVRYATTSDPLRLTSSHHLTWSPSHLVPHARTAAGPAASAVGAHGTGPLLLTYKAPSSLRVRFQLHYASHWSGVATVGSISTAVGPALLGGVLATTNSDTTGNVVVRSIH